MSISVGDRIPDIEVMTFGSDGPERIRTGEAFGSGKVVLEKDITGFTLLNVGTDLGSADRQAISLLADDLARNITLDLTEGGW